MYMAFGQYFDRLTRLVVVYCCVKGRNVYEQVVSVQTCVFVYYAISYQAGLRF